MCFSSQGQIELYTAYMVFSFPEALVLNLHKNLNKHQMKKLTKKLTGLHCRPCRVLPLLHAHQRLLSEDVVGTELRELPTPATLHQEESLFRASVVNPRFSENFSFISC